MAEDLDVLGRLRKYEHMDTLKKKAADEIELLSAALALAVGELSTHAQYSVYSPEQLMQQFLEEARRD